MPQTDVRALFLTEFIRHILIVLPEHNKPKVYNEPSLDEESLKEPFETARDFNVVDTSSEGPKRIIEIREIGTYQSIQSPLTIPKNVMVTKLEPLINDPTVQAIECEGPDKPIIVRKGNEIKTIPLQLSQKEIDDYLNQWSIDNGMPPTNDTVKIENSNLTITGIRSELAGNRFIFEKKRRVN